MGGSDLRSSTRVARTWSVYLLACSDGTIYCGTTVDVEARVAAHDAGRAARYTRGRRPVRLVYREEVGAHAAALRREWSIKRLARPRKLALIASWRARRGA